MECGICYELMGQNQIILNCAHSLCQRCLEKLTQRVCPFCRKRILRKRQAIQVINSINSPKSLHINLKRKKTDRIYVDYEEYKDTTIIMRNI